MAGMGISELLAIAIISGVKLLLPIAFALWAIIVVKRIRVNQGVIQSRLDALERRLNNQ